MLFQCLCYFIAAPFLLTFVLSPNYVLIATSILIYALARSIGGSNAMPLLCDFLQPKMRATAIGLINLTNCFAAGVGIFIAGYLKRDFGLGGIFAGISGIVTLAAILLLIGYLFYVRKDLTLLWQHTRAFR